jgi:hypothetical protein
MDIENGPIRRMTRYTRPTSYASWARSDLAAPPEAYLREQNPEYEWWTR